MAGLSDFSGEKSIRRSLPRPFGAVAGGENANRIRPIYPVLSRRVARPVNVHQAAERRAMPITHAPVIVPSRRGPVATGIAAWALLFLLAWPALASNRPFSFIEHATTEAKGEWEYEQWVTWEKYKRDDNAYEAFSFRHEIEYGVTDRFQVAVYLASWSYANGASVDRDGFNFDNSAIELKYNFTDPTNDPIGIGVYFEYAGGPHEHELEGKLLLQKNFGQLIVAYNLILANEWEQEEDHGHWEKAGEFSQTLGVSYQVSPKLSFGGELVHKVEFPEWETREDHQLYMGPNVAYRSKGWWVVFTPTYQITNIREEPEFVTRLIFGIEF